MPKCKHCGKEIVWLKTKKGHNVPMDPEAVLDPQAIFDRATMTSHFDTCPEKKQ